MTTFTIITSTLNSAGTIEACLESVRRQDFGDVEHLVVDGSSSDGTAEILARERSRDGSRLAWWCSEPDDGIYDAWNKALGRASGEWVLFLGADDELHDGSVLSDMAGPCMDAPSDCAVVYGKVRRHGFTDGGTEIWGMEWPAAEKAIFDWAVFGPSLPHQAAFHRRTELTEKGGFDRTFKVAGDSDMLLKLLQRHRHALFVDRLVTDMAVGGLSGDPSSIVRNWREDLVLFRRHHIPRPALNRLLKFAKWYLKIALFSIPLARPVVYRLADLGRRLQGRDGYWSRLKHR